MSDVSTFNKRRWVLVINAIGLNSAAMAADLFVIDASNVDACAHTQQTGRLADRSLVGEHSAMLCTSLW